MFDRSMSWLTKAMVARVLFGGPEDPEWALLTSDLRGQPKEARDRDRALLRNLLDHKRYDYLEVDGVYGGEDEAAVLVIGMHSSEASRLALFFSQDAFITKDGLFSKSEHGWYARRDVKKRMVVFDEANDGSLRITLDRSVIHCADGRITLMVEA